MARPVCICTPLVPRRSGRTLNKAMSNQQVIYEAKLAKVGTKGAPVALVVLVLWLGAGYVLCFLFTAPSDRLLPLCLFGLGAVALAFVGLRMILLRRNAGYYRISIDDHGLYVQSDDPLSPASFSVKTPDLCCLVRKTFPDSERSSDDYFHQYFVETKSGTRHEIDPFFAEYDSNPGRIFGRIRERFPWVQIREERG